MTRFVYRSAYLLAVLLFAPSDAAADAPEVTSTMQCDRATEPGRVRCTVEARSTSARVISWADVEILSLPDFASALKGRIGRDDAISRDPQSTRWALGLVARRAGQGEVKARVRVVACETAHPTRCAPLTLDVRAQISVG